MPLEFNKSYMTQSNHINNQSHNLIPTEVFVVWAIVLYVVSLILPGGVWAFMEGGRGLLRLLLDWRMKWIIPFIEIAWLANPALWAAIGFLAMNRPGKAFIAAELAILLALCVSSFVLIFIPLYFWVGSMAFVLYPAILRLPPTPSLRSAIFPTGDDSPASIDLDELGNAHPPKSLDANTHRKLVIGITLFNLGFGVLMAILGICLHEPFL